MNKIIVVTGATGFVGRALVLALLEKGYDVRVISRSTDKARLRLPLPVTFHEEVTPDVFNGTHAVIHLAGEPIAENRWSEDVKKRIRDSRVNGTRSLVKALKEAQNPPEIFISASAIGYYGTPGDVLLEESSPKGEGFLSDVCQDWEMASEDFSGRRVFLRTGVVLGHGGALEKMLPAFRLGVGGKLGRGNQWMSWIHLRDLVNLYVFALENESVTGPMNATAPAPVTNEDFTKMLGKSLNRPVIFPVPATALKLLFGEMSSVLLDSQWVSPKKAQELGFHFTYPHLTPALEEILRPLGLPGAYVFEEVQWLPEKTSVVFPFFAEAKNLEKITPPWLNFHITAMSTPEITEGSLIDYRLRIKGVPARWRTLISSWKPGICFVDEQLKGPYKIWHHTHHFQPLRRGTLMKDCVVYQMPFGPLGDLVRLLVVAGDIRKIFGYRRKIIDELYGNGPATKPLSLSVSSPELQT